MVCAQCKATVPDESTFCLQCGARIPRLERPAPVNGRGTLPSAATAPEAATPAATPTAKQPYALSFKPLADERLRYRVARWVCEVAPAHALGEVQADLSRGAFATFLALTAQEAEVARQRIEKLGAHPALWRLAPATTGELLLPTRESPEPSGGQWSFQQKLLAVGVGLTVLFIFGVIALYVWGPTAGKPTPLPTTPPGIVTRP